VVRDRLHSNHRRAQNGGRRQTARSLSHPLGIIGGCPLISLTSIETLLRTVRGPGAAGSTGR